MRLIFWNCGVAPPKGTRSSVRSTSAASVIRHWVHASPRPALIVLCEADEQLVRELDGELGLGRLDYREKIMNDQVGQSRWDFVVLFDTRQVQVRRGPGIVAKIDGTTLRAGHGLHVQPLAGDVFDLFIVHWPSRILGWSSRQRQECAKALWHTIAKRLGAERRVVVLGDFNDEPHDPVMCDLLYASRDPEIVTTYSSNRLYNPSWWISAPTLEGAWEDFGTMRFKRSGVDARWHALDQALTCHQWLDRERKWAPQLRALRSETPGGAGVPPFDHVPIELRLTR